MKKFIVLFILINTCAFSDELGIEVLGGLSIEELSQVKISSIATGTTKTLSQSAAIASVITAKEIEAMGSHNLEEVLESVPGLHVSYSELYSPKYQVRGISTKFNSQILVMINGIPITSVIRGDRNSRLGVLPVKMISKVEIIRGPGSALYGGEAVAGVINVITKDASDIKGTQIGVRGGSFDTKEFWYLHGDRYGDLNATLMVAYESTDGHKREVTEDAQTRLDKILGTKASLAPGHVSLGEKRLALFLDAERDKWRLRGSLYELSDGGLGHGATGALDPYGKIGLGRSTLDLTYSELELSSNWSLTARASYLQDDQQIDKPLTLFPAGTNLGAGVFTEGMKGSPEYWERQARFDITGFYTGSEGHKIRIGTGYFFADLFRVQESHNFNPSNNAPLPVMKNVTDADESYLPEKYRTNYYGYAQDEWQLAKELELTAGVRYDHYSEFHETINPRADLIWNTTSKLTTKFLYGRAFRPPTFAELYTKNNPVNIGNPNLKPERINVYEMGWAYQASSEVRMSLNFFYYNIKNLIITVQDSTGLSATSQNHGLQDGRGFEFETSVRPLTELTFTGNYAFLKAKNKISGKSIAEYPSHKVYVRGDWSFLPKWIFDSQVIWLGKRERDSRDARAPLKGYTSVNVNLKRIALFKNCDVALNIKNIFDADLKEPSTGPAPTSTVSPILNDLPLAGRTVNVSLSYNF